MPFSLTIPYFVQAVLPFGDPVVLMDMQTGRLQNAGFQRRETVTKKGGADVRTTAFLDPDYVFVSAILHSAADCVNGPRDLGRDFTVLHNPTAEKLDPALFSWCTQMFYSDGKLKVEEAG